MSRDDSAAERRWQFSLRGMLLLTAVVAAACVSWHFLRELAIFGLPFFMGLTGAMLSRRNRWGFSWMFILDSCKLSGQP